MILAPRPLRPPRLPLDHDRIGDPRLPADMLPVEPDAFIVNTMRALYKPEGLRS